MPTQAAWQKIIAYCLIFISLVLFIFLLKELSDIVLPFVIAAFLALLLDPLVELMRKWKVPRWAGIGIVLVLAFGFIYLIGFLIMMNILQFTEDPGQYTQQLQGAFGGIQAWVDNILMSISRSTQIDFGHMDLGESVKGFFSGGIVGQSISTASGFVINFFMVVFYWLFMMAGKPTFEKKLKIVLEKKNVSYDDTMVLIKNKIQNYLSTKTLINLANAGATTILMLSFGLDFAFLIGFLILTINYIPNAGAIIGGTIPALLALIQFGFGGTFIIFFILLMIIQLGDAYYLEPTMMATSLRLSAVYVIVSIVFWAYVWGVVGAFLAVPIASLIKIFTSNVEPLKAFSVLIGDESIREVRRKL